MKRITQKERLEFLNNYRLHYEAGTLKKTVLHEGQETLVTGFNFFWYEVDPEILANVEKVIIEYGAHADGQECFVKNIITKQHEVITYQFLMGCPPMCDYKEVIEAQAKADLMTQVIEQVTELREAIEQDA